MKILIGADLVPTKSNFDSFISGDVKNIIGEKLEEILTGADYRIFNLEVPLTDFLTPIKKRGKTLRASTECVNGMKKLGVNLFTLANNHIMDQGVQGIKSTLDTLKENGIEHVGAGENLSEAQKPYIIEKDGIKIGIYACAEHEFSIAEEELPGANPFDPLESLDHIAMLKSECNYVIVLYHGGKEYYRYPSPLLQKTCRKICEKGADLVVCQHSHCVGCEEKYNDSTIVYGQGNFIFDAASNEFWNNSILIEIEIKDKININYIPLEKRDGIVEISLDESIITGFKSRSKEIELPGFIKESYSELAEKKQQMYLQNLCGVSFLFRVLNKLSGYRLKKKVSEERLLAIRNYTECETHRELLIRGVKNDN